MSQKYGIERKKKKKILSASKGKNGKSLILKCKTSIARIEPPRIELRMKKNQYMALLRKISKGERGFKSVFLIVSNILSGKF